MILRYRDEILRAGFPPFSVGFSPPQSLIPLLADYSEGPKWSCLFSNFYEWGIAEGAFFTSCSLMLPPRSYLDLPLGSFDFAR